MIHDDWAVIIPAKGDLKATARLLVELADDPRHVRTDGNGTEFRVPAYLGERYTASFTPVTEDKPRAPRRRKKEDPDGD